MIDWLQEFYGDDLRESLLLALGPLFASYARDVWRAEGRSDEPPAEFVSALAAAYADHHLNSSRIQLQQVVEEAGDDTANALRARFAEWAEKRPGKVAANEIVRAANALAVERMKAEGTVTKVWQSSGSETCPYCTGLNGRAVEIERPFFTETDSYQPEGAEGPLTFTTSIGHPPIHQGCDCSVVPG